MFLSIISWTWLLWEASQLKNIQNNIGSPYFLNLVVNITWGCSIKSECYFLYTY